MSNRPSTSRRSPTDAAFDRPAPAPEKHLPGRLRPERWRPCSRHCSGCVGVLFRHGDGRVGRRKRLRQGRAAPIQGRCACPGWFRLRCGWGGGVVRAVWVSPNMVSDPPHVHIRSASPGPMTRAELRPQPLIPAIRPPRPPARRVHLRPPPSKVRKPLWMWMSAASVPGLPSIGQGPSSPRLARTLTSLQHGARGDRTQRPCVESMMGRRRPGAGVRMRGRLKCPRTGCSEREAPRSRSQLKVRP